MSRPQILFGAGLVLLLLGFGAAMWGSSSMSGLSLVPGSLGCLASVWGAGLIRRASVVEASVVEERRRHALAERLVREIQTETP